MTAIKAYLFDVFGTCVDWRSTIIREGAALNKQWDLSVDWAVFADRFGHTNMGVRIGLSN